MPAGPDTRHRIAALCILALLIGIRPAVAQPRDPPSSLERIPLQVTLNTANRGELFAWRDAAGLWVAIADLDRLGIPRGNAPVRTIEGKPHAKLDGVDGVSLALDEATLLLAINVDPALLASQRFDLSRIENLTITPSSGVSGYLNYSLNADRTAGQASYDANLLANVAAGGWLARTEHQATRAGDVTQNYRLRSFVQRDWPGNMTRLVLGDFNTSSGPLARSFSMAGISFGRAFELQPGLVTAPTARIAGIAAAPSTAEIYVDGVLIATRPLQPGPYDFTNLQDFAGLRNIDVLIRDASGVRERLRVPYYFTERLLKEGFTDFNVSWGAQREDTFSDKYGAAAFSAFVAHGVTDALTLGAAAQHAPGYSFASAGAAWRSATFGVFAMDAAAQRLDGGDTTPAGTFSWRYTRGGTTLRALVRGYGTGYRTNNIIDPTFSVTPLAAVRREATVGWDQNLGWSLLLSLHGTDRRLEGIDTPEREAGASLSVGLFGWATAMASVLRRCPIGPCTTEGAVNLSVSFGDHYRANAGWRRDVDGSKTSYAEASRTEPEGRGYGWRVGAQESSESRDVHGDLTLRFTHGVVDLRAQETHFAGGSSTGQHVGLSGSLACVGSSCNAMQPVTDAFAVVDLNGLEGVRVSNNNQYVDRSRRGGEVFVATVPALTLNEFRIAGEDIPISIAVPQLTRELVPATGVGYRVSFDLRPIAAITGSLVRAMGDRRVPVENTALLVRSEHADAVTTRTGPGGRFEIDRITAGRYHLAADTQDGPCNAFIDVPATREGVQALGEIHCEVTAH